MEKRTDYTKTERVVTARDMKLFRAYREKHAGSSSEPKYQRGMENPGYSSLGILEKKIIETRISRIGN